MNNVVRKNLTTLLEKLENVQASTHDVHAEAIREARLAFEARLVQAVAYKLTQALDVITAD